MPNSRLSYSILRYNAGRTRTSIIIALSAVILAVLAAATLVHFNTESTPTIAQTIARSIARNDRSGSKIDGGGTTNALASSTPISVAPSACLLGISDLAEWLGNGAGRAAMHSNIVSIDTRAEGAFAVASVPNSLNLPIFSLKSKPYLKTKRLLLLGEPYQIRALDETCNDLQQRGFGEVQVLVGGLESWQAAGLPLHGDALAHATRIVSAQDFVRESQYRPWIVVNASNGSSPLTCSGEMITLPYSGDLVNYVAQLKSSITANLNSDETRFCALFLDDNFPAKDIPVLTQMLTAQLPRTFIVDGGVPALELYQKQHAKSLKNQPSGELPVFQCRALR